MKKSEVKELFLSRGNIAEDIRETYFLTSDGTPINLGSRISKYTERPGSKSRCRCL